MVSPLIESICVIKVESPHGRTTKALASSHPTAVESKSSSISTLFPAGIAGQKEANSSPTNSQSMVRVALRRKLSRLLANSPRHLRLRAAATFLPCSPFVFSPSSLVRSSLAGCPLLSSRFTFLQVSLPSPSTHSTSLLPYGVNGEPEKVRCTYSPFLAVGPALWPHSDCFGTSQLRRRFRLCFGSLSRSTAGHSVGRCRPRVQEPLTLCSVPYAGQP